MNRYSLIAASALSAVLALSSNAQANEALAKSENCMTCHGTDKKVVGPAFTDIAKKYAGNAKATAALTEKVMKGGVGAWGAIPMPANPQVTEAEAKTLVTWILGLK